MDIPGNPFRHIDVCELNMESVLPGAAGRGQMQQHWMKALDELQKVWGPA